MVWVFDRVGFWGFDKVGFWGVLLTNKRRGKGIGFGSVLG